MNREKIKGSEEEVLSVKRKYKKMKLTLLIIILLIIILYLVNLLHTALQLQKVLQHNVNVNLGNNYKLTRIYNGRSNTLYYKDGTFNSTFSDNQYSIYGRDNNIYQVMYETKEYQKINNKDFYNNFSNINLLNYWFFDEEYDFSLKNVIVLSYQSKIKFSTETQNNQNYIILNDKSNGEKIWINPKTYLVEKENMQGQIVEQIVEKNVVTDNDVLPPWDLGFSEKAAVN